MELLITLVLLALTVLAVAAVARRYSASAPLLLLVVGLIGSYLPFVHQPGLAPELVLIGILPPLLYASARATSLIDFRENASAIGWLSIGLVLFTALGVALLLTALLPIPFAAAFAIGAVVAPPDAVAATAVARQIGLPRRVVTILEGESLVNDATALVSLRTATVALGAAVTVGGVLWDFVKAVVIAIAVGFVVAKLVALVQKRTTDTITLVSLSFVVPFLAYAPAEELHASGVLAVVIAGLLLGHKAPMVQTAASRVSERTNWATVQFLLENTVFLLIGLQASTIVENALTSDLGATRVVLAALAVLVAVVVLRVVWVMATRALVRVRRHPEDARPWRESVIISWAGMRGVVTLAAALTLTADVPYRDVLVFIALVVTAGTLLLLGLTLPWLARRLDVHGPDPREDALQMATLMQRTTAAGMAELDHLTEPGDPVAERIRDEAERRTNAIWESLGRPSFEVDTPSDTYRRLRLATLAAEREELLKVRSEGWTDAEVFDAALASLDVEESMISRLDQRARAVRGEMLTPSIPDSPCEHLAEAPVMVEPTSHDGCLECKAEGLTPDHLRLCLTCGNVGCCDSSVGKHASKHYETAHHPVMRSIEPGEHWRWCFVDDLLGS